MPTEVTLKLWDKYDDSFWSIVIGSHDGESEWRDVELPLRSLSYHTDEVSEVKGW